MGPLIPSFIHSFIHLSNIFLARLEILDVQVGTQLQQHVMKVSQFQNLTRSTLQKPRYISALFLETSTIPLLVRH